MSLNTSSQTRLQTINNLPRYKIDTPGQTASQSEFILFCYRGCNLNLNLGNATNLTLKNSNKQLIITANGTQKIGWSGSGANGLRDVNFDLKEIIITAPQKYILSGEIYNKGMQFYLTFTSSQYPNLMVFITVVGNVNDGNQAQSTMPYKMFNQLTNIPINNGTANLTVSNFNLRNLLPNNTSFITTISPDQSTSIITMQNTVFIPQTFFNNFVNQVLGGPEVYNNLLNEARQAVSNPEGTQLFYNQDTTPLLSGQQYVCNRNCQQVPEGQNEEPSVKRVSTCDTPSKDGDTPTEEPTPAPTTPAPTTAPAQCEGTGPQTDVKISKGGRKPQMDASSVLTIVIFIFMFLLCLGFMVYKISKNQLKNKMFYVIIALSLIFALLALIFLGVYLTPTSRNFETKNLKENAKCKSGDEYLGEFESAENCAQEVYSHNGKYFSYGNKKCYKELTEPDGDNYCPAGYTSNNKFNFYEVLVSNQGRKIGLLVAFIIFTILTFTIFIIFFIYNRKIEKSGMFQVGNVQPGNALPTLGTVGALTGLFKKKPTLESFSQNIEQTSKNPTPQAIQQLQSDYQNLPDNNKQKVNAIIKPVLNQQGLRGNSIFTNLGKKNNPGQILKDLYEEINGLRMTPTFRKTLNRMQKVDQPTKTQILGFKNGQIIPLDLLNKL